MQTVGDAIYEHLAQAVHLEVSGWAAERVCRVTERLQVSRPAEARFQVHVPWMFDTFAFTAPGRQDRKSVV